MQLALEIYARMPLIPRCLILNGVTIKNGNPPTLANGRHEIKATFRTHKGYGIFVCCQLLPPHRNADNVYEVHVPKSTCMGDFDI
jgi:hypothetical protein